MQTTVCSGDGSAADPFIHERAREPSQRLRGSERTPHRRCKDRIADGKVDCGLEVRGKARFKTVGSGTFAAGTSSKVVANADVTGQSHITVTFTSNPGKDVSVVWIERIAGTSFTIRLNKAAPKALSVGWFIVN